jgi:hypothetical protein
LIQDASKKWEFLKSQTNHILFDEPQSEEDQIQPGIQQISPDQIETIVPDELPILPLRGLVVYPLVLSPHVTQNWKCLVLMISTM